MGGDDGRERADEDLEEVAQSVRGMEGVAVQGYWMIMVYR